MRRISRWMKALYATSFGAVLFASGSCVPDNLWANIWGTTIIDGLVAAVRDTVLVATGLQTP